MTTRGDGIPAATHIDPIMETPGYRSAGIASARSDHDSDTGDSVGSYNINIVKNGSSCYSTDSNEDDISLVPEWKDDGDDSIYFSTYNKGEDDIEESSESRKRKRIPSTLEFTVKQEEMNGEEIPRSFVISSRTGFLQETPSLLRVEMIEDDFPSLPVISSSPRPRSKEVYSNLDFDVEFDAANTERRNGFRRRPHNSAEMVSTDTNSFSESQSSLKSLQASATSRHTNFSRITPRIAFMFAAMTIVMLSIHDNMKNSRQFYRRQHQLLSSDINNRRQEIAFPLMDERAAAEGVLHITQEKSNIRKAELPKFYFPKADQHYMNSLHGSVSSGRAGSNLVMGRSQQSRPIFVPDIPLPDGGFRKPLKRFVFEPRDRELMEDQQRRKQQVLDDDHNSSSSWTSLLASLTLIGILFETGWKGYRKYRITAIPSLREE